MIGYLCPIVVVRSWPVNTIESTHRPLRFLKVIRAQNLHPIPLERLDKSEPAYIFDRSNNFRSNHSQSYSHLHQTARTYQNGSPEGLL